MGIDGVGVGAAQVIVGYDPTSLRAVPDLHALGARLSELGELRSSTALNEKVGLLTLAGRLDEAWDVANAAVREARFGGDREQLLLARIRRAQVQQYMGRLDAALIELADCVAEAGAHEWHSAHAFALQHRGKVHFDRDDFVAAHKDFSEALAIRTRIHSPTDQIENSFLAVRVALSRLDGGPA
jgi:tetratricopeptide (TPR) repeat protein